MTILRPLKGLTNEAEKLYQGLTFAGPHVVKYFYTKLNGIIQTKRKKKQVTKILNQ